MDGRLQCNIDKKKSRIENQNALYETLFDRNIANHKVITKYVHYGSKMTQLLLNIRKVQSRQRPSFSQNKSSKKMRIQKSQTIGVNRAKDIKQRIIRPKTSKQRKIQPNSKTANPHQQKIYELLRVI